MRRFRQAFIVLGGTLSDVAPSLLAATLGCAHSRPPAQTGPLIAAHASSATQGSAGPMRQPEDWQLVSFASQSTAPTNLQVRLSPKDGDVRGRAPELPLCERSIVASVLPPSVTINSPEVGKIRHSMAVDDSGEQYMDAVIEDFARTKDGRGLAIYEQWSPVTEEKSILHRTVEWSHYVQYQSDKDRSHSDAVTLWLMEWVNTSRSPTDVRRLGIVNVDSVDVDCTTPSEECTKSAVQCTGPINWSPVPR